MIDLKTMTYPELAAHAEKVAERMREMREQSLASLAEKFESMAAEFNLSPKAVLSAQKGRRKQGRKPSHPTLSVVDK